MIQILEKGDKKYLARIVAEALPLELKMQAYSIQELSKLHEDFGSLLFQFEKAMNELLDSRKSSFNTLVQYAVKVNTCRCNLDKLIQTENISSFLKIFSPYCHFLNCHLLLVLVQHFLQENQLLDKLQAYVQKIEHFKNNTEIKHLYKTLTPFTTKSPKEVPVTMVFEKVWERQKLQIADALLKIIFQFNDKDIPKLYSILPGSIIMVFLVHQCIISSLIEHSEHKIQFMKLTGIISLQIGSNYIVHGEDTNGYDFEKGLIMATEVGNYQAVQFLLQHVHVDVNTQTVPDEELIVKLNEDGTFSEKEKKKVYTKRDPGTTALMIACCNGNADIVQILIENNANRNLQTTSGWTALMYSCKLNRVKIMNLLSKPKAGFTELTKVNNSCNIFPLLHENIQQQIYYLIRFGMDVLIPQKTKVIIDDNMISSTMWITSKPTVWELDLWLTNINYWQSFAINLPQIRRFDIETVEQNNPYNINKQKQAIFEKWLQVYPNASWEIVILALEKINHSDLAQKIQHVQAQNVSHSLYILKLPSSNFIIKM